MFQCPTSGFSLFYGQKMFCPTPQSSVSMPYFGLFSFLRNYSWKEGLFKVCFNALLRVFLFSTEAFGEMKRRYEKCFNALLRAFLFSTFLREGVKRNGKYLFQCPTSGFSLFYTMALQPLILLALQIHFCV